MFIFSIKVRNMSVCVCNEQDCHENREEEIRTICEVCADEDTESCVVINQFHCQKPFIMREFGQARIQPWWS